MPGTRPAHRATTAARGRRWERRANAVPRRGMTTSWLASTLSRRSPRRCWAWAGSAVSMTPASGHACRPVNRQMAATRIGRPGPATARQSSRSPQPAERRPDARELAALRPGHILADGPCRCAVAPRSLSPMTRCVWRRRSSVQNTIACSSRSSGARWDAFSNPINRLVAASRSMSPCSSGSGCRHSSPLPYSPSGRHVHGTAADGPGE